MDFKLIPEKYNKDEDSKLATGFSGVGFYFSSKANLWLVLSLILLAGAVFGCFWAIGYRNDLANEKEGFASVVEALQNQRDLKLEADFIDLKDKIDVLKNVWTTRLYSSRIFGMLEESALSRVRFIDLRADLSQMIIKLKVETADYNTLAKQFIVFKEDSRIKKVDIAEISLGESGEINSEFSLEIDPSFLRR